MHPASYRVTLPLTSKIQRNHVFDPLTLMNESYDPFEESIALSPLIGLSIVVKLYDDNYLIWRE